MPDHSASASVLGSKSYVFDPRPRFPFRIVAKRYWIGECPDALGRDTFSKNREGALTLVFMHGNGVHKEHWEPTIQRLFENQQTAARRTVRFHDMWSLDMPNQGDSAILNEDTLLWGYDIFSWEHHARGVHAFLAGLGTGVDVDFSKRRLSLVGHSMGGPVIMLATTSHPLLKVASLHLIEPSLFGDIQNWGLKYNKNADKRQDIWPSSEEAFQELRAYPILRNWDERILKIYVEHGLRPLPTAEYPDLKEGVTLKCTRKQQAATFRDRMSYAIAYRYLPHILKEIPTHITYGTVMDFVPEEWQQDVLHIASRGISNFASVTRVPGAGHMIVQTHPDGVADVIWKSLTQSQDRSPEDTVVAKL